MIELTPKLVELYQEAEVAFAPLALTGRKEYREPAVAAMKAFVDEFTKEVTKSLIEKALQKMLEDGPVLGADGGVVSPPAPQILTNEYVVPKRAAARLGARAIRSKSRKLRK